MKVAIAGHGIEGESNYAYWQKLGADITIFDEKQPSRAITEDAKAVIAPDAFSRMNGFDLVVRTAGLNPGKITTDGKIWSSTNEFFARCPAEIIGVTGTKGKGTTSSLIAEILKAAGKTVHLLGNIGQPALDILPNITPDDLVVFELSSFQLWDLEKSPQTAVVLMIEPDHMDVHASMEEYIDAKANIGLHQSPEDVLVYHPSNEFSKQIAMRSPAQNLRRYMTPEGALLVDDNKWVAIESNTICETNEIGLIGGHNLENICAAITAAWRYTNDTAAIKKAVTSFKGLPHRLEFVREQEGVKYYNDSFSSAPGATIAAIQSFTEPEILICGGFDRGLDYTDLAAKLAEQKNLKKIVLIGQTAEKILVSLKDAGVSDDLIDNQQPSSMQEILQISNSLAKSGDVVLLSPGCASFDMFKDFKDRGEQFMQIVRGL
jgi:UDP-N-acetylmuramoylalanine--D-glutamate ligase